LNYLVLYGILWARTWTEFRSRLRLPAWSGLTGRVRCARMANFRQVPVIAQSFECHRRTRNRDIVLLPMCVRCLIAPIKQAWHGFQVVARITKLTHGLLIGPYRDRPETEWKLGRKPAAKKSRTVFGLTPAAEGINDEGRQKSPLPDMQSGHRHEDYLRRRRHVLSISIGHWSLHSGPAAWAREMLCHRRSNNA
jgi:hypothetical protein